MRRIIRIRFFREWDVRVGGSVGCAVCGVLWLGGDTCNVGCEAFLGALFVVVTFGFVIGSFRCLYGVQGNFHCILATLLCPCIHKSFRQQVSMLDASYK